MNKTLLEKAKEYKSNRKLPTDEEIELALGWIKGEVGITGIGKALGHKTTGNVLGRLATYLRGAYEKGKIIIK